MPLPFRIPLERLGSEVQPPPAKQMARARGNKMLSAVLLSIQPAPCSRPVHLLVHLQDDRMDRPVVPERSCEYHKSSGKAVRRAEEARTCRTPDNPPYSYQTLHQGSALLSHSAIAPAPVDR